MHPAQADRRIAPQRNTGEIQAMARALFAHALAGLGETAGPEGAVKHALQGARVRGRFGRDAMCGRFVHEFRVQKEGARL